MRKRDNAKLQTSAVFLLLALVSAALSAQEPLKATLGEETFLTLAAEERARWEVRENADFTDAKDDDNNFVGNRLRLSLRLESDGAFTLFLQGQDSRQWGSDQPSTDLRGHYDDLRQIYADFKGIGTPGLSARLGRQELVCGEERLVGAFGWSNVGRSFDAVKGRYAGKGYYLDAFLARARKRPLLADTPTQTLSGVYSGWLQTNKTVSFELYALLKNDSAWIAGELPGPPGHTRIPTYGTRVIWKPVKGLSAVGEFAFQFGHKGPDEHRSDAQAVRVDYSFPSDLKPLVGLEYCRAKGDENPYDGKSGSFDNLFPTNHNKYGYMDLHNWSNLRDFRVYTSLQAAPWIALGLEGHQFYLESARAPWTSAGGAVLGWDPSGRSGTHVGKELDFTASGALWGKRLNWLAGYSLYWPGEFCKAVRGSDPSRFAYLQVTLSF